MKHPSEAKDVKALVNSCILLLLCFASSCRTLKKRVVQSSDGCTLDGQRYAVPFMGENTLCPSSNFFQRLPPQWQSLSVRAVEDGRNHLDMKTAVALYFSANWCRQFPPRIGGLSPIRQSRGFPPRLGGLSPIRSREV